MDNRYYFEKYANSKICLYLMIGQFFDAVLSKEETDELGIKYKYSDNNKVDVCFHNYQADGLRAWDLLDIKKPYISYDEMWDKRLETAHEGKKKDVDYYTKYLNNAILLLDMTLDYYKHVISIEDANNMNVKYDSIVDEADGNILVCNHWFETAGEQVWNLFDIDYPVVARSVFENIRRDHMNKLLDVDKEKIKVR